MKVQSVIFLAMSVVAAPMGGWSQTTVDAPQPVTSTSETESTSQLSVPAQGMVKMANSGVSEDVIKSYVENAPTVFNLTADNVIELQKLGISHAIIVAMLSHDKLLRDSMQLAQTTTTPPPDTPPSGAPPPAPSSSPSDDTLYSNLAPYGTWQSMPDYGYYWQPYAGIGYNYYPWSWLGYGYWSFFPSFGWCWFPHSHFRDFHGFNHFNNFNRGAFVGNRFGGSQFQRTVVSPAFHSSPFTTPSGLNRNFHSGASFGGGFRSGGGSFHGGGSHGGHR